MPLMWMCVNYWYRRKEINPGIVLVQLIKYSFKINYYGNSMENRSCTLVEIQFKVKHLMITTVTGYFKSFDCTVETETEDFNSTTNIIFTADVSSINTNNEQRDTHLKSSEFFDMEKYGQVLFTGTRFEALQSEATLQGNLTIRGVTKPITLKLILEVLVVDPYGQKKAGFTISGKISRKEYGLTQRRYRSRKRSCR